MPAPHFFVSTGTLVPPTPSIGVPRLLKAPFHLPHKLGLGPSPDRFIADAAYGPLKELGNCWVVPLSWLGLDGRDASVALAKAKLRQLLEKHPGARVILIGQSQGGLVTAELVLDPEFRGRIVACVFAGTPFRGSAAIDRWYLRWSTALPGVKAMQVNHHSLIELGERIEATWPSEVIAVVAASPHDELVSLESARGVRFPPDVDVRWYHIDDRHPDQREKGVEYLQCGRRARHLLMCRGSLIPEVQKLRQELTPVTTEDLIAA